MLAFCPLYVVNLSSEKKGNLVTDSTLAIETNDLRKTYPSLRGRKVAVEGLSLRVPAGGVHGFLGPNGSGKTTTIRMLLGLIRPDSGDMKIFGQSVPKRLPQVVSQIGAIVEQPKFFPNFSAQKNLQLLAQAMGVPEKRITEVLTSVGLADRKKDKFRTYSLGMKQRLAIAATLLKDPQLLIFDEPTNGLDPAGIREIRDTMRNLGNEGKTVLVSSHILSEVEQIVDSVSVISRGTVVASGNVTELLARGAGIVTVGLHDPVAGLKVLQENNYDASLVNHHQLQVSNIADAAEITRVLAASELYVNELHSKKGGLEDVFLELTNATGLPLHVRGGQND